MSRKTKKAEKMETREVEPVGPMRYTRRCGSCHYRRARALHEGDSAPVPCDRCNGTGKVDMVLPFLRSARQVSPPEVVRHMDGFEKRVAAFNRKVQRALTRKVYGLKGRNNKANRLRYGVASPNFRAKVTSNEAAIQLSLLGVEYTLVNPGKPQVR